MNFKCDECDFTAPHQSKIKWHKIWRHSDHKPWGCKAPGCSFTTKTVGALNIHMQVHKKDVKERKPYACTFESCEYRGAQAIALRLHVKSKHTPGRTKDFQCPMCPAKYLWEGTLKQHIPLHTKELKFTCKQCDFTTHYQKALALHVRTLHIKPVRLKCSFPGCTVTAPYKSNLLTHQRIHDPDPLVRKPVACKFTGCAFRARSLHDMKVHANALHNPTRTKDCCCPMCPKRYYSKHDLRIHISSTHAHEETLKCKKCLFVTKYASDLRIHCRRVHGEQPEKMFKCESCDYRTATNEGITLHKMTIHSAERMFQCNELGCSFRTNYRLSFQEHLLTHEKDPEGKFPFPCTFPGCDYRRATTTQMKSHLKLHETSKSLLKCDFCPSKNFPDEKALAFHIRMTHSKLHKCSACSYSVYKKCNMAKHIRKYHLPSFIRVTGRVYRCTKCEFETRTTSSLAVHRKRMHGKRGSLSSRILEYEMEINSYFISQCLLCNYCPVDDQDAIQHAAAHKSPIVLLNRLDVVKL